jgi:probable F420-dependent oxidoreductase
MKIGFTLPQFGGQAHGAALIPRYARELEEAGAHGLWVGDRLIAAVDPTVGYGGADTIPEVFNSVLDPFVVLSLAAAATERVRLGSNVLNAPWYQPAVLARLLTSIDTASGGRLAAGFGIGWSPEEYQAAAVPFTHRGARLDETLDALETIWTSEQPEYSGRYAAAPRFHNTLRPAQNPHPPIYLAAFTEPALKRVARRGTGWLPVLAVGRMNPDVILGVREKLYRAAEEAGHDPSVIGQILRVNVSAGTPLTDVVAATLDALEKTGIDEFFIDLTYLSDTVDDAQESALELLKLFDAG